MGFKFREGPKQLPFYLRKRWAVGEGDIGFTNWKLSSSRMWVINYWGRVINGIGAPVDGYNVWG